MRTSDRGIALIKAHEGLRLQAYQDPVGVWTIGFGHTTAAGPPAVTKGMKITEAGAEAILRDDLRKFEGYVTSAVHVPLTQEQFDALVSFTFNLGPGNLKTSTLLRKLNSGDYLGAADQFLRWDKAGGKTLRGLTKRREAERALFLAGMARPAPKPAEPPKPAVMPRPVDPAPAPDPDKTTIPPAVIVAVIAALAVGLMLYGG